MVNVKICGITNLDDALGCADAGANLLGFNFYPGSARYISPEAAYLIIHRLPSDVTSVGVFVNEQTPERVKQLADVAGVKAIQLHGDESPAFCERLQSIAGEQFVIKALRVGPEFKPAEAARYTSEALLLDGFDEHLRGGTGKTFDWSLAVQTIECVPRLFLAGGLLPENVAEAIATVHPYAVDACGGLERSPGRKDLSRVRAFIAAAK